MRMDSAEDKCNIRERNKTGEATLQLESEREIFIMKFIGRMYSVVHSAIAYIYTSVIGIELRKP